MNNIRLLIACEESQRVCIAFRERGFEAYSADIQEPSGSHPEWHILGNVLDVLNGGVFYTMDCIKHTVEKWDCIIAHPPCTYLSNAGACRLYKIINGKTYIERERFEKGLDAKDFFFQFYNSECEHIAVENPVPSAVFRMPDYTQSIQPYEHGEPYSKKTCLWLKGLPLLKPSCILNVFKPYISCGTSINKGNKEKSGVSRAGGATIIRSKTFHGIAQAMAQQWGDYLLEIQEGKL